jgi:DNA-binding PadR family transcriptional regulator
VEYRPAIDFIPLKQSTYGILLALGDGELHGYGIMQSLEEKTGGRESILPGTLYASLARMASDGLVAELDTPEGDGSGGPKRRYYRRTELGRAVAREESERLRVLLRVASEQDILTELA